MKRFHVHVAVKDLAESVRFYSTLFVAEPTVLKSDYAKWMLEDPCVNFAISTRRQAVGMDHSALTYFKLRFLKRPQEGFERIVAEVAELERMLGIDDLAGFAAQLD